MKNPYVGPRAFHDGETLYGRGDDAARLFHLLLADRIVLLYSPSGAGKTSLLEAQLTRRLREEEFTVIYDIRMHREPAGDPGPDVNRYVLSAMLSIEKALPEKERLTLAELAGMTLPDYLKHVQAVLGGKPVRLALLFDQFEEVFRLDETDADAKLAFFTAVGQTLENRSLHAVFAMREDAIAFLDDYCHLIPSRLKARQRLSLLTREQAVEAIRRPAAEEGVEFTAADDLAHDLSRTTTMLSNGSTRVDYGQFVEPVQLQVVCYTVWDKPRRNAKVIDDLSGISVDTALADYYNESVAEAVKQAQASERDVRDWFARSLITPRGIRTQVLLDEKKTEGLSNEAIDVLVGKRIVRREERGNRTWFELSHDRLVNPIRTSNEAWNALHLTPLQDRAAKWQARNQDAQLLFCGRELIDAIVLAKTSPEALTTIEKAFISRSREALSDIEREAVEWDLAGRTEEKLLRGGALRAAEQFVRQKGEYSLTPEAKALLAESRATRRERNVARYSILIGGVVLFAMLGYARFVNNLRRQDKDVFAATAAKVATKYFERDTPLESNALRQAVDAQTRIEDLVAESATESQGDKPFIHYYVKQGDDPRLRSALAELGFVIYDKPANTPEPTNCIWYGTDVDERDVKLVAYAVIRAGAELQSIQPIPQVEVDRNVIRVGHNQYVAGEDPLTSDYIKNATLQDLHRPRAHLINEDAEGIVKTYDAEARAGTIASAEDLIPFRVPPGRPEVQQGETVAFVLFENATAKRKYAMNVRPIRTLTLPGTDSGGGTPKL